MWPVGQAWALWRRSSAAGHGGRDSRRAAGAARRATAPHARSLRVSAPVEGDTAATGDMSCGLLPPEQRPSRRTRARRAEERRGGGDGGGDDDCSVEAVYVITRPSTCNEGRRGGGWWMWWWW